VLKPLSPCTCAAYENTVVSTSGAANALYGNSFGANPILVLHFPQTGNYHALLLQRSSCLFK
jgi:hypothetical protein